MSLRYLDRIAAIVITINVSQKRFAEQLKELFSSILIRHIQLATMYKGCVAEIKRAKYTRIYFVLCQIVFVTLTLRYVCSIFTHELNLCIPFNCYNLHDYIMFAIISIYFSRFRVLYLSAQLYDFRRLVNAY